MERITPGVRIGDYLVDEELPGTSTETVFAATHVMLPRRATLRVLRPTFVGLRPVAVHMLRESCVLEALRHIGVPRVFECGVLADKRPWLAIELVDGSSLAGKLMSPAEVAGIIRDVADVLDHAHALGVVHRNLKPQSISRGQRHPVCVSSWGDARIRDTAMPQAVPGGSQHYRAPELACGETYDGKVDVYSLGVIAFELLHGAMPAMVPVGTRWYEVPTRLVALIERMMSPDPKVRPLAAVASAEAERIAKLEEDDYDAISIAPVGQTPDDIEDVRLVAVSEDDVPETLAKIPKPRWTPAHGIKTQPGVAAPPTSRVIARATRR